MRYLLLAIGVLLSVTTIAAHAESRGNPWSEEQLFKLSDQVFVGEVLETTAFDNYQRTVPRQARVLLSLKGNVPRAERAVVLKSPGAFVYFDEEFSQAEKGQLGVFYVGTKNQPNLLMGYRQVVNKDTQ